ncbi:STAS domain-containing protein [Streptomyces liliiviolaceus]|uniref:STAS domain-containing protein n=1 Tax=Streptomyces liliiviolaceus TaxID=2823109 RepID=UPI001FFDA5C7|nr:STAS domain-containing protein [Streptomyces liliiviolaceus]
MPVPVSGVERSCDVGAWAVLALSGEIDLGAVPRVREVVGELVAEGRVHLVWDLREVSFMDSAGLGVLVAAVRSAEARQGEVRLAGVGPQVSRLLELTGLDAVIGVYADVPSAAGPAAG